MSNIESIAATHPKVGVLLSPEAQSVRGQLGAIGFSPCDATDPDADWLVTDGERTAIGTTSVPVLCVASKMSVFRLEQAIVALFAGKSE
jgi:hypothetical protein